MQEPTDKETELVEPIVQTTPDVVFVGETENAVNLFLELQRQTDAVVIPGFHDVYRTIGGGIFVFRHEFEDTKDSNNDSSTVEKSVFFLSPDLLSVANAILVSRAQRTYQRSPNQILPE